MNNKRHMEFTLPACPPVNLKDLANDAGRGVDVLLKGEKIGRTVDATAHEDSLVVVIELFAPKELPLITGLYFRAVPRNPTAELGTSLIVTAVEAKTGES